MNIKPAFLVLSLAASLPAWAEDSTTISIGLRAWMNSWTSWDVYPPLQTPSGSVPGASENFTSGGEVAIIPSLTLRYGNLLLSASHFADTDYSFDGNSGSFKADRQETDALVGYYVLPTLAVTLGYKEVKQDFGGSAQFKYSGPILGAVASAPLTSGFSLYGTFGYGRMNARLPVVDADGRSEFDADYLLGEVGLAYSLDAGSMLPGTTALTLTIGYRNQVLATRDFRIPLSATDPGQSRATDIRDTTEGLTLGLIVSF